MQINNPYYVLALDFGGTKLASAVVEIASGSIVCYTRQPTPSDMGAEACLEAMTIVGHSALVQSGLHIDDIEGIGISFGGPVSGDRRTVLRSFHVSDWDSFALPDRISTIFKKPVFMDNDGNAAALGEWYYGICKGKENMMYIQISTGVGSGLIINQNLYRGLGLAGEFGHMIVMPDGGPLCSCGKNGCIEAFAAGWAIARDGRAALVVSPKNSILKQMCGNDPQNVDAEKVFQACRAGDPQAQQIIKIAYTYLGVGIANIICLLDPDQIVIGGGISKANDLITPILHSTLIKILPSMFTEHIHIEFSNLDGTETLLGAALLTQGY